MSDTPTAALPPESPLEQQRERESGNRSPKPEGARAADEPGLVARPDRRVGAARALAARATRSARTSTTPTEFAKLDVEALKADVISVITTSQDWWPADYGSYAGLFIRMSWHAAGTYRIFDGRGGAGQGMQRFAPLNSWPDNANLDKARRLLWPVKKKYGNKISWADLLVFAGNVRAGVGGLRDVRLRLRPPRLLGARRGPLRRGGRVARHRQALLRAPSLRAAARGTLRRHHDGPDLRQSRRPRRQAGSAGRGHRHPRDVRPDGDERRGDRRADRRRPHPRQDPRRGRRTTVGPEPEGAPIEQQGLGWKCPFGSGKAGDTITSGLEVVWTPTPTQWSNGYLEILYGNEWELTKSPGGAWQFEAKDAEATIPDPFGGAAAQADDAGHRRLDAGRSHLRRRSPGAGSIIPRSSTRRSPRPGTSCCTATWVRSAASSDRGSPSRSCGRTRCPPSRAS